MMWLRTAGYWVPSCPSRKEGRLVMDKGGGPIITKRFLEHPKAKIKNSEHYCQDSWDSSNTQEEVAPPFSNSLETFASRLGVFFFNGVSPPPLFS
jgi:hypothetical protein